jgi:hypothetical protein
VSFGFGCRRPKDVIASAALLRLELAAPEMKERRMALGNNNMASGPEEFGQYIQALVHPSGEQRRAAQRCVFA